MNVATLAFERTRQRHCRTLNTSGGSSMAMSCFTLTWQDSRTPQRASPRETWLNSVGRMAPPPSCTVTVHTPQLPLPPQAEGMKMRLAARVPSRVPPALVVRAFSGSPFTVIVTSPVATSCRRAAMSTATSDRIVPVNIATPRSTVITTAPPRRP